jgi:hypothetical protein
MKRLMEKSDKPKNNDGRHITPLFDHLILIDRDIDFVTPFCTPLNYEGLLDEMYSIKSSTVEIPIKIPAATKKTQLSPISQNTTYTASQIPQTTSTLSVSSNSQNSEIQKLNLSNEDAVSFVFLF